jgi:RHS repeat-associated protein
MWGFVSEALWENGQLRHVVNSQQGVPQELVDERGQLVWHGTFDDWGRLVSEKGTTTCRLRLPGQIADDETGLHYNRFRYYSPEAGQFVSADPIGFAGGTDVYRFASNTVNWCDPLGLNCPDNACKSAAGSLPQMKGSSVVHAEAILRQQGFTQTNVSNSVARNQTWRHPDGSEVRIHPYGNQAEAPWRSANNAHVHKQSPSGRQLTDRGIPSTDPSQTHIGIRNPSDLPAIRSRPHGAGTQ